MKKFAFLFTLLFASACFAQNTHTATLTWSQSPSSGVTSNNVYFSTTKGGPYTSVFSSASPITTYTVTNLAPATTYYFVVTAVCATCSPQESAYSNEASATTKNGQPQSPSSLTVTAN